jgi:DNA replication protein DnaC
MNENVYNLIKSEYQKRQKDSYDELVVRRNEVYIKVPRIEEIENQIHTVGIKHSKMILLGTSPSDTAIDELLSIVENLKEEKKQLLFEYGYPSNYLEMTYQCPACKDTGFIESEGGTGKCSCYKQLLINQLYSQSNLSLITKENFGSFNESLYSDRVDETKYGIKVSPRENIIKIRERCERFIDNFSMTEEKNLFFSGPAGVGKTFMSSCIACELLNRGITVLYQTAPVLFNIISEYKTKSVKDAEYQDESYRNIFEVELLIIDDLGTESPTAARYAELLTILNTRQTNSLAKPCRTIISTNIGPKKLFEYYTERVASRIIGCFDRLMFAGDDIRSLNA